MNVLFTILTVLVLVASVLITLIVLLQNGKGGGLASNFVAGNQTFGVRQTADILEKITWGLVAFIFDSIAGVMFAKFLNLFSKNKINPMVGAAGISAFPMSARVIQKIAKEEDPYNFILMQSISANVSGQLGSIVAGGMVITLVSMMLGGIW